MTQGAWVARSVTHLTLGCGSDHDLTEFEPGFWLCAEQGLLGILSLFLALCPSPAHALSVSLSLSLSLSQK